MTVYTDNLIAEAKANHLTRLRYGEKDDEDVMKAFDAGAVAALEAAQSVLAVGDTTPARATWAENREAVLDFAEQWYDRNAGPGEAWTFADLFDALLASGVLGQPQPQPDRRVIAWLLWCANEGYLKSEDREVMDNWFLSDPANDHPDDNRAGWLALADDLLASGWQPASEKQPEFEQDQARYPRTDTTETGDSHE